SCDGYRQSALRGRRDRAIRQVLRHRGGPRLLLNSCKARRRPGVKRPLSVLWFGSLMTHLDIAAWESFAVALAGASAVLAGLVFVAVSINIDRILRVQGLPGRAGESVILLIAAVCVCAFVLVAHQPVTALAVELVVAGALTCVVLILILLPALRRPSRQPLSWPATRGRVGGGGARRLVCTS